MSSVEGLVDKFKQGAVPTGADFADLIRQAVNADNFGVVQVNGPEDADAFEALFPNGLTASFQGQDAQLSADLVRGLNSGDVTVEVFYMTGQNDVAFPLFLAQDGMFAIRYADGVLRDFNAYVPSVPESGTHSLKAIDGQLQWVQE